MPDTGFNPYHEVFRAPGFSLPRRVLDAHPIPIRLTLGPDWQADYEADKAVWSSLEREKLYWFVGTRVLGIAFTEPGIEPLILDDAYFPHGSGTSATVATEDPNSLIVMVTSDSLSRTLPPFFDPQYDIQAMHWMVNQSWIDEVSISLGAPAGLPINGFDEFPNLTAAAVASGKVVIAGTGNDATPSLTNQIAGPPWVVKAGGVDPGQQGETVLASKGPDFVGDFVVHAACAKDVHATCEYLGTSFSTPTVAGAFSRAIHALRVAAGQDGGIRDGALVDSGGVRVTNRDLREAFNRSALYWNTTDYAPAVPPVPNGTYPALLVPFRLADPVLPTPWVQMGWGYANGSLGERLAQAILAHRLPSKPDAAVAYMQALDAAREQYWQHPIG